MTCMDCMSCCAGWACSHPDFHCYLCTMLFFNRLSQADKSRRGNHGSFQDRFRERQRSRGDEEGRMCLHGIAIAEQGTLSASNVVMQDCLQGPDMPQEAACQSSVFVVILLVSILDSGLCLCWRPCAGQHCDDCTIHIVCFKCCSLNDPMRTQSYARTNT